MDVDVEILDAARPAPTAAVALDQIGARFAALVEKARAHRAVRVELVVVVFGDAAAELERLEKAPNRQVGAKISAGLPAVENGLLRWLGGIERKADRHAILKGVAADRDADVEVAIDVG